MISPLYGMSDLLFMLLNVFRSWRVMACDGSMWYLMILHETSQNSGWGLYDVSSEIIFPTSKVSEGCDDANGVHLPCWEPELMVGHIDNPLGTETVTNNSEIGSPIIGCDAWPFCAAAHARGYCYRYRTNLSQGNGPHPVNVSSTAALLTLERHCNNFCVVSPPPRDLHDQAIWWARELRAQLQLKGFHVSLSMRLYEFWLAQICPGNHGK